MTSSIVGVTPTASRPQSRNASGQPSTGGKKKGKKSGNKTKKVDAQQRQQEQLIAIPAVEDNPKYLVLLEENQQLERNNSELRKEIDTIMNENEQKDQKIKDLELELKFSDFQRQGQVDGALVALKAENAANSAASKQIVIERLD